MSAQVKITFEDAAIGSTGGATAMWSAGTVDVLANAYLTGNASGKVLHVNNTNYLPIYFSNMPIPAGAEITYSTIRVKYLIIGGTDTNYPSLEIFSSPNNTTAGATEKIGQLGWQSLWGTAEIGVWKTIEFSFANSLLKPVPAGNLILKLSKSNTEYLIDDIELVLTPVSENGVFTVEDFESRAINDVFNMKRWSTADGSAIVEANPTDAAKKSVHIVCSNYDALLKLNVALPTGKVLADYEKLMLDIYLLSGFSNHYKKMNIYVDGTKVYEDSDNPNQASDATWTTKEYAFNNLAGANAFVLDLGLSTNNGNYYIDNVKLVEKGASGITLLKPVLTAGARTDSSLAVSWAAINDAASYSLVYGKNGTPVDTVETTVLTKTISKLDPSTSYFLLLFANSSTGVKSMVSDSLKMKTAIKKYDGEQLYYTDLLTTPITYPATGNLYNKVFTADTVYTFGTTRANTLKLYVPANTSTQRMHFNNIQAAKTDLAVDYGAATANDLGATVGSAQILSKVGAYFVTPKVAGPARITIWVADGGPGSAKTTMSRMAGSSLTYTDPVTYTNGGSNKYIYKFVYDSEDADSVQFKIALDNVKIYLYNIKVQSLLASNKCEISSFTFGRVAENDTLTAPVGGAHGKINIGLPARSSVTNLVPTIVTSPNATISPASGVAANFTNIKQYTVTAQDGTTKQIYDVKVTVSTKLITECDIKSLSILNRNGVIGNSSVNVTLFKNQGVLGKYPVVFYLSDLATTTISSGDSLDFTSGSATLRVTAQDESISKTYTINLKISERPVAAYITASGTAGPGTIYKDTLDTKIYPTIGSICDIDLFNAGSYNTSTITEAQVKAMFESYDLVFASETIDGVNKLGVALKYLVGYRPFLNTKVYFYTVSGRWGWAAPVNGDSQNAAGPIEHTAVVDYDYTFHTLFRGTDLINDNKIKMFDRLRSLSSNYKGFQGFTTAGLPDSISGLCLASPIGTPTATCVHEIRKNPAAKYILLAFCSDNFDNLSADGVKVVENAVNYLLGSGIYTLPIPIELVGTDMTGIKAWTRGQTLFLEGLVDGSMIEVYSISGIRLYSARAEGSSATAPVNGLNIVKITSSQGTVILKTVAK